MRRAEWVRWVWAACCCLACDWHNIDLDSGRDPADANEIPRLAESCDGTQEYRCSGADFQRCTIAADGPGWITLETCASAESCGPLGGCLDRPCVAGQRVCVGPQLRRCNAGSTGFDLLAVCDGAQYCDPDGCRPNACQADEQRCNGDQIERCKSDGSGWDVVERCADVLRCDRSLTQCKVDPCEDSNGRRRCNGQLLEMCVSNGDDTVRGWWPVQDCGSAELCRPEMSQYEPAQCVSAG
jgi:hypothetical protein